MGKNFTPGPWATARIIGGKECHAVISTDGWIADLHECTGDRMANAQLIACAPELLELLKIARDELFNWFKLEQNLAFAKGQTMDLWEPVKRMNKIIEQAEGKNKEEQ
jgi:hypothetical protein